MPPIHDVPPPGVARLCRDVDRLLDYVDLCGGIADRSRARRRFTEGCVRSALSSARLIRVGRSGLALPCADRTALEAYRHSAVVSHRSAAARWGWPLVRQAPLPELVVPRGRQVRAGRRGVLIRWADLPESEVIDGVTSPVRTVLDCASVLPFPEALAVADSALRSAMITRADLISAADLASGQGAPAKRLVAGLGDARAANPFESALRGILLGVPGLDVRPQWQIRGDALQGGASFAARVDLADPRLKLVAEADSFEHHGGPAGLARDARRYDELVARGWTVLRFTYAEVMGSPEWVAGVTAATVEEIQNAQLRSERRSPSRRRRPSPGQSPTGRPAR